MADIELVIKVPEEKYQGILNMAEEILDAGTFCSPRYLYIAVLNGTPLPKGHGRLVDADAILEEPFGNTYRDINIAETIIEAESEDK